MKTSLKESVVGHLGERVLTDQQLQRLESLQETQRTPDGSRRTSMWALVATLVLAASAWLISFSLQHDMVTEIAEEVVANHLKLRPLEVEGDAVANLQPYFGELGFQLTSSDLPSIRASRLLGGRYCSIQGVTAAQLRLLGPQGQAETVYQAAYASSRFGELPDLAAGAEPQTVTLRGLQVDLWVEKGILFARVRD